MIFQHHRFQIWNKVQHPYSHSLSEFSYINPALPEGEVQTAQQAMDWIIGVVYPGAKDAVDTPALLPLVGNSINDYRIVNDDGDGKAASYRWMQLEGDAAPEWKKIYDMDWGEASILSNFLIKTQDVYVYRYGIDDLDGTGTPFIGDLSGQRVYGGESAGTHLTLFANSGDGVGVGTGFVQFGDNSRPLVDSSFSLGTDTYRFLDFFTDEANISTMTIVGGSITDTSGAIDFGDEDLSTSGTILVGSLLLQSGSITDSSGAIDFADENLTTLGLMTADGGADIGTTIIRTGGAFITEALSGANFTFIPDGGLSTFTGDLTATGNFIALDGNFKDSVAIVSASVTDDLLITVPDGDYVVYDSSDIGHRFHVNLTDVFQMSETTIDNLIPVTFLDQVDFWGGITNYLRITPNRIDSLASGPLTITGHTDLILESNDIFVNSTISATVDGVNDLGYPTFRWGDLFLSNSISDGTDAITTTTLLSFRSALVGATAGMSLFYDGSLWLASIPDTEIDHGTISGIADDDHLQYALLAGRSTGQIFFGGIDASDDLLLDSTAHAIKGYVRFASILVPHTDNTIDIGTGALRVANLYMGGQGIGFRMENSANFAALPAASGLNTGRLAWTLDTETIYVDKGGTWKQITTDKYVNDDALTWNGTNVTQIYNTSGDIDDARTAIWQFLDNTNGFRNVDGAVITKSQTQVTVTFTIPPALGTYRLVGVG